jgi:hypothetical protein
MKKRRLAGLRHRLAKRAPDGPPPGLCSPVSIADAVAELSRSTGSEALDFVQEIIIDCLQQRYLIAFRDQGGCLRFEMGDQARDQ